MSTVYIETSVISYLVARPSRDLIVAAHQQLTTEWWQLTLPKLEGFISPVVLEEIARGDSEAAQRRLEVVESFEVLELVPEIKELADQYFQTIELPEKARADAYHLALSVWHGMDYLATWNCQHIAGARVKRIVEATNRALNLQTPIICTPEELMEV